MIYLAAAEENFVPMDLFLPQFYDILWSVVVFSVLLFFFWKFAVPKFHQILDDRSAAIEGGIEKAEAVQAEAAAALEEYNQMLADARSEAAQVREQARLDGAKILADLKESATVESARILANAQLQIEAERQAALVSLRAEVGTLALDLATGVLGESLKEDKKANAVVDRFLGDLTGSDAKAGK
ncbi:MAG: F0F1 ATP synthase subunit B [Microbacteriaceae bacterium]